MSEEKKDTKKPKFTPDDVEDSIEHPYFELYRHTILRGANAGSLLPILFAPPILFLRGARQPREILYNTARASMYGVVIGSALSALGTYMIIRNQTDDQVFDRSYRLRYNKGQVHLDKVTYGVVGTGALAGAIASPFKGTGAILGASLGFGLSVFMHMATKYKD